MILYAYMSGSDNADIVAVSDDFDRLVKFAETRSGGEIPAADWVRHFDGAWSPIASAFRRPYWWNPSTKAVILEIGNFGGEVLM